ncbi:SDR family NAD(P)-dependent oxidoreductase [Micromonospora zhanjiangensis]|uniref:SDR family NAD(P)-dependent oxidoreductase n=1 Tax=Micromonospora zhanjiangensis TaxID=1522057 RepID=A0ABV8KWE9_9ACTN
MSDRVVVVTGGTRGLGLATARRLRAEGARVVCAARDDTTWDGLRAELPDVYLHRVDVTAPESVRELFAAVHDRFGGLDMLVCNAGVARPGPVSALSPTAWREVLDVNVTGAFICIQEAVPYLEKAARGRIVTISSALATRVAAGASAYSAAKAALEMLTRTCALELGPRGILVNAVSPGFIDEGMGRDLMANPALWQRLQAKLVLGRAGNGEEVAGAVAFLAGDDSTYVNGHVLEVNGGLDW